MSGNTELARIGRMYAIGRSGFMVALGSLLLAAASFGGGECEPMSPSTVARLEQYVHDKFHFAPTTAIKLLGSELVGSSCYRTLRFGSEGSRGGMRTALYLAPDQRFLSRDLMDSTVDLVTEAAAEEKRLAEELGQGTFPSKGSERAAVRVTIFSDFECRFCKQELGAISGLNTAPDSNVRLVFRHLPLPMHPLARKAAEMAACVYQQSNEAFWSLHDTLFRKQENIDNGNIDRTVEEFLRGRSDVNAQEYEACITGHKGAYLVEQDIAFAKAHDIHRTPTIFINGVRNEGVLTLGDMQALINLVKAKSQTVTGPATKWRCPGTRRGVLVSLSASPQR